MYVWRPNPDYYSVFFIIPGLWGMADAVWQTQINGKTLYTEKINEKNVLLESLAVRNSQNLNCNLISILALQPSSLLEIKTINH